MPEECASIRSMARCVLPVLVGPSTAVTPEPRARSSRSALGENEIDIESPTEAVSRRKGRACLSQPWHWKALCLTCGTSLERIAAESATPSPFGFVHCDIWPWRRCCIPDRVESDTAAPCLGSKGVGDGSQSRILQESRGQSLWKMGTARSPRTARKSSLRLSNRMRLQRWLGNGNKFGCAQ